MKVIKIAQTAREPQVNPLFTGLVTTQSIVGTDLSKKFRITQVNFGRGIRNKFHSHTIEQILIVTEGKGLCWDGRSRKPTWSSVTRLTGLLTRPR